MQQLQINKNNSIKIKTFNYTSAQPNRNTKSRSFEKNPIRIVVDKLGSDGQYHRQIINQIENEEKSISRNYSSKMKYTSRTKKEDANINNYYSHNPHSRSEHKIINSQLFNRFLYNNKEKVPATSNRKVYKVSPTKINYNNNKNLEIVFCETKFPDFVNKTNEKIQEIFKKQQSNLLLQKKKIMMSTIRKEAPENNIRKNSKTTLANCLKEFGTLEKLSSFMQSDRKMRQSCLCFIAEKDQSKTLLLDVLTHRFTFMKKLNKRLRENIYRIILGRDDINIMTKINIQQYMRFYELFVGRDSSSYEMATFMYLFLFGNNLPTFQLATTVIQQINGSLHKQRVVLQDLKHVLRQNNTLIMETISINPRLIRNFIDLLVEQ